MSNSKSLIFGLESNSVTDIREQLEYASQFQFEFIVAPLFHPRLRRDLCDISSKRLGPSTRSDQTLESQHWIANVVGSVSSWIDLDGNDPKAAETYFLQEINWAIHLSLQAVVLPTARNIISPNYSRMIQRICLQSTGYQQYWIKIPLYLDLDYHNTLNNQKQDDDRDGWIIWNNIFQQSNRSHKLHILLEINEDLPLNIENTIHRWKAEPLKGIILSISLFQYNKSGFPILTKNYQTILITLLQYKLHIIFKGKSKHNNSYESYYKYIFYLQTKNNPTKQTEAENFTKLYKDTLQLPLQPLMDNLESQTYEVFERDPIKYSQYELAIIKALNDLILIKQQNLIESNNIETSDTSELVVMVVGAGRGPLVACTLSAALITNIKVKIYAIEKNQNAIITLKNRVITENWTNVTIISHDMRTWKYPELADLIVSELLGSFGDNELSPECLDGAQRFLNKNGIMIPSNYTSYLAPMSSSKLWMNARDISSNNTNGINGLSLETPFVVKFHNCNVLTEAKPLFYFIHPNPNSLENIDNSRYVNFTFCLNY